MSILSKCTRNNRKPIRIGVQRNPSASYHYIFLSPWMRTFFPERELFLNSEHLQKLADDRNQPIFVEVWQSEKQEFVRTDLSIQPGIQFDGISLQESLDAIPKNGVSEKQFLAPQEVS